MPTEQDSIIFNLQHTLSKMELGLSFLQEAICWLDPAYTVQWSNAAFDNLTDLPHILVLNKSITELLKLRSLDKSNANFIWQDYFQQCKNNKNTPTVVEGKYEHKNQQKILSISSRGTYTIVDKEIIIVVIRDVSQEKEYIAKLLIAEKQLAHADRLSSLGMMSTNIAHELNQPLAIIKANMQILEMNQLEKNLSPAEFQEIITNTIKQADRSTKLIDHMRAFVHKDAVESKMELVDIIPAINDAESFFVRHFSELHIEVEKHITTDLPKILGDNQSLEQIVVNVLSNAKDAIEEQAKTSGPTYQKKIEIIATYQDKEKVVCLEIKDNGCGLSPTAQEKCFDPFYTTKPVGKGTGLGLSIVYNLMKKLGGSVAIESTPALGTSVIMKFVTHSNMLDPKNV